MDSRSLSLFVLLAAAALLAACGQKEPKTVAYYTANPAERDQVVARCRGNPGKLKDDPDCINASDSVVQGWGKAKLPPVTFATKPGVAASK